MKYKVWFGLAQNDDEFTVMRVSWMPRLRDTLDEALWEAMKINDARRSINGIQEVVWEIEADDGSRINRQEIGDLVRKRRQELANNPPQKY